MRLFKTSTVTFVLGLLVLAGCISTSPAVHVPLPNDVKIVPPDSGVPSEIRGFSGKWYGVWKGKRDGKEWEREHMLVVERIDRENDKIVVRAIYGCGVLPPDGEASFKRSDAEVDKDNYLILTGGPYCDYQLQPDGTLKAHWWNGRGGERREDSYSIMRRVE